MKVLFDTQIFDWQINGGISRYFIEVLQRLDASADTEVMFKCTHSYNTYIQPTKWLVKKPMLKDVNFKGKLRALKSINERVNRRYSSKCLKKHEQDIFHPTYYDPYFLPLVRQYPFVLTVYDLTHEKFFSNNAATEKILRWKKKLILSASHIISISENTKKDIVEQYKISPEKVTTVYLSGGFDGATVEAGNDPSNSLQVSSPYILFVGSRSGYKNFQAFVKEVAPVLEKENISLVIAGGGNLNGEETGLLNKSGLSGKYTAFSHVSDAALSRLYSNAVVFVFPSLYEGFGIPVLEAMQCGCPALLSNNSSLPEVGGNAAAYFDPFKEGSLRAELEALITDPGKRKEMISHGNEQLKKFNWDETARGHIAVYKELFS